MQPFVAETVILEEANNGRGLTARLVYAVCAERAGSRKAVSGALPDELTLRYESAVQRCLKQTAQPCAPGDTPAARLITLSGDARDYAILCFDKAERRITEGTERAKAWNGKAFGLMMRIAGVFHAFECLECGQDPAAAPLPEYVMVAAALVTECLAAHAGKVFAGSDKKTSDAQYLLRRIGEMGGEFGKQELWQRVRKRFGNADAFDDALRMLEDSGYIRMEVVQGEGAGRPRVRIQVNPAVDNT